MIDSDAQFQDYINFDFNDRTPSELEGSGNDGPPENNLIQSGKYLHK